MYVIAMLLLFANLALSFWNGLSLISMMRAHASVEAGWYVPGLAILFASVTLVLVVPAGVIGIVLGIKIHRRRLSSWLGPTSIVFGAISIVANLAFLIYPIIFPTR